MGTTNDRETNSTYVLVKTLLYENDPHEVLISGAFIAGSAAAPSGNENQPPDPAEHRGRNSFMCSIVCRSEDEAHIRTLLLYAVNNVAITLRALDSEDLETTNRIRVRASLFMVDRNDALLEQVVSRLSLEPSITAVSWKAEVNGSA